jgi:uncharacterized membrane protein
VSRDEHAGGRQHPGAVMSHAHAARRRRLIILGACAVVVIAGVLQVLAARGDLWFDEIWSLRLAEKVDSAVEIVTILIRDNNHILNTLWMYTVGDPSWLMIYRLPAVSAGVGAVVLSGLIARRWGTTAAVLGLVLTGLSYPLVHYSSEARGYAPAVFFGFAALLSLDRFLMR